MGLMDKKITVKHFLNKRLKPEIYGGEEYYPVYTQVTYDRKNAQFKMNLRFDYFTSSSFDMFFSSDELPILDSKDVNYLNEYIRQSIQWREKIIYAVLEKEITEQKEKFKLSGFGKRFAFYETDLWRVFYDWLQKAINEYLKSKVSINFYKLLEALENIDLQVFELRKTLPKVFAQLSEEFYLELSLLAHFRSFIILFTQTPKLKYEIKNPSQNQPKASIQLEYSIFEWFVLKGKNQFVGFIEMRMNERPTQNDEAINIHSEKLRLEKLFPLIGNDPNIYIQKMEEIIETKRYEKK